MTMKMIVLMIMTRRKISFSFFLLVTKSGEGIINGIRLSLCPCVSPLLGRYLLFLFFF